jgi:hypothetical protein
MPAGVCSWAWADVQRDSVHPALDGDVPWMKQRGTTLACCTDGLRPVIFKLERIEPTRTGRPTDSETPVPHGPRRDHRLDGVTRSDGDTVG